MALAVGPVVRGDPGFQLLRTGHLSSVGTCRHPPPITGRGRSGGAENHISMSKNSAAGSGFRVRVTWLVCPGPVGARVLSLSAGRPCDGRCDVAHGT